MERYYENWQRKHRHDSDVENGRVYTFDQIYDIVKLVKEDKGPDYHYSDDECRLYELIKYGW